MVFHGLFFMIIIMLIFFKEINYNFDSQKKKKNLMYNKK